MERHDYPYRDDYERSRSRADDRGGRNVDIVYEGRPLTAAQRSRSLDTRRDPRNYDYERSLARSQEWQPWRSGEWREQPREARQDWQRMSPRSATSSRRPEKRAESAYGRDTARYDVPDLNMSRGGGGGGGGGGHSSSRHRSSRAEWSSSRAEGGFRESPREAAFQPIQQPLYQTQQQPTVQPTVQPFQQGGGYQESRGYQQQSAAAGQATQGGGGYSQGYQQSWGWRRGAGGPAGPQQHYKIRCCCLTFTWPPWGFEPVAPPQPIYRNI